MVGAQGGAAGPVESGRSEPLNAPLFRSVVERFQEGERAVILDLGPAQPATISLFGQFRCRLDIADIAEGLGSLDDNEQDPGALHRSVESLLPPRREEPVDLVLCWDLLNYLTPSGLRALTNSIAERGRPGTVAHALIAYSSTGMPARPNRYSPTGDLRLTVLQTTRREAESPRYTPETLGRYMPRYRRERAMLLRNGMQEYLFVI